MMPSYAWLSFGLRRDARLKPDDKLVLLAIQG